uniref:Fibrinogen C-terminal domain-containing protein n=1 Tax=Knipowitschia caucasica TaxID=637954 RepID=A0AAV2JUV3_KNICA
MRGDLGLVLLLVLVVAPSLIFCDDQTASPTAEIRSHFAALDEVRLLATGLLQLGQSLREFVQKTKGQMNDIVHKLNIVDHSFNRLTVLASEIKEEEEELKKTTVVLKASNEEMKDLSVRLYSKVDTILQEKSRLQNKVQGLEERLSSMSQGLVTREQVQELNALRGNSVLHIQLEEWKQSRQLFEHRFNLDGPQSDYTIQVLQAEDFSDLLGNHTDTRFSTKDRDNDHQPHHNCAKDTGGGWWFHACGGTNLNGKYMKSRTRKKGIQWRAGKKSSLKFIQMSVRPPQLSFLITDAS